MARNLLAAALLFAVAVASAAAPRRRTGLTPSPSPPPTRRRASGDRPAPPAPPAPPPSAAAAAAFAANFLDSDAAAGGGVALASPFAVGAPLSHARCPFDLSRGWRADDLSLRVTQLVPDGRMEEAWACSARMLEDVRAGRVAVSEDALAGLEVNEQILATLVAPRAANGMPAPRVYHNVLGASNGWPANSSDPLPPPPERGADPSIMQWDGVFSRAQCEAMVELFEASPQFDGNLFSNGRVQVNHAFKKAREVDVSSDAASDEQWAAVDRLLLATMTRLLAEYEARNPAVRDMRNPLADEGFRMKRYRNDGREHHAYHVDAGQEPFAAPRRVIAVLMYVNDVEEGGETVFLNQGRAVAPRCGRAVFFPAAFTHVHAGRRPVSGPKYVLANFIAIPQPPPPQGMQYVQG